MKNFSLILIIICCLAAGLHAQNGSNGTSVSNFSSFINFQKTLDRPGDALSRKQDTLQKQFKAKGLVWPAKYVYVRSFKYDSQLEVWVKNEKKDPYKLFKSYRVCALAGSMGPKRIEGDYQVPEGFYYINEFNPKSTYHLSLGLNYPNSSDKILSDAFQPGGEIYIHGSCVTVGCIPLTDPMIEEVYIITAHAKDQGQDFIPVHIFPIKFNVKRSAEYFEKATKDDHGLKKFALRLEDAFNYFERHKQVPVVLISEKGEYVVNDPPLKRMQKDAASPAKRQTTQHRVRKITELADVVYQWPQYPGGGEVFLGYLEKLGKEMEPFLPESIRKVYAQVEFIIDKDGTPVNFKVLKGLNEEFNDELITKLETTMSKWNPALLSDKPVAKKMVQTVTVALPE